MNGNLEKWIREVNTKLDNHLDHVADDFTEINKSIAQIATDLAWLKKFFWIVATGVLGGIVATVMSWV